MRWLRRFRVFANLWWRLFAWGQSRTKKVVTVLGLILAVIGIPALLDSNLSLHLLLNDTQPHVFTIRLGVLVGAVLLAAWAFITGAIAWERSGVPVLIVGDDLEWDGLRYRLTLQCKDKPYETSVRLLEVVDATGRNIVPTGRLNVDMDWTHHSGRGDVHIKKNQTETVAIATIRDEGGKRLLRFTGATYGENILIMDRVYFHLLIAHDPKPIDRWFCFRDGGGDLFGVSNEAPPTQQPAIPLESKHDPSSLTP